MKNYIEIFGFKIYYYAIMIVMGIFCGIFTACVLAKRRGYKSETIFDIVIVAIPLAIIGARLYYVLFSLDKYNSFWDVINIRSGGLAVYGGFIGGAIGVLIMCKVKKLSVLRFFDIGAPCFILGQAIGRWGNFFNQEAYGNLVTNPKMQWFPYAVQIDAEGGKWFQATFFYESMWNFIVFAALVVFAYMYFNKADGLVMAGYLVLYGIGRTFIEGLRADSLYLGNTPIRVSQLLSVLFIITGLIFAALVILNYYFPEKLKPFKDKFNSIFKKPKEEAAAETPEEKNKPPKVAEASEDKPKDNE